MFQYLCIFLLLNSALGQDSPLNKDANLEPQASSATKEDLEGMALVCFPGNQCTQFPAEIVYEALARVISEPEDKRSGAGYLFRSRRGQDDDEEEEIDTEKRGNHGYLLRTRKSTNNEPTTRTTRGSYLFRTRKSDNSMVPERNSRGGYLFRTRKSSENDEMNVNEDLPMRMERSSKGYLFRTRKSAMPRFQRGGVYLFRT